MILLDTHTFLWLATDGPDLKAATRARIDSHGQRFIAAITLWEAALLNEAGKIRLGPLPSFWLERAIRRVRADVLPLTPAIAVRSVELRQEMHRDPADCFIVATAQVHGLPIATRDALITAFETVETIW